MRDTWTPVSHKTSNSSWSKLHFTMHLFPTSLAIFPLCLAVIWLLKKAGSEASPNPDALWFPAPESSQILWHRILWSFHCSFWHFYEQYLTHLHEEHCLNFLPFSTFPQLLQEWDLLTLFSVAAKPCPSVAAIFSFPKALIFLTYTLTWCDQLIHIRNNGDTGTVYSEQHMMNIPVLNS